MVHTLVKGKYLWFGNRGGGSVWSDQPARSYPEVTRKSRKLLISVCGPLACWQSGIRRRVPLKCGVHNRG